MHNHKIYQIKLYFQWGVRMALLALLIFISFPPFNASAEEHSSSAKEESTASEGEESKSEKKEGAGYIKKDEYLELNSAIEQLGAKLKSKNENLKKMMQEKDQIKDSLAFKDAVKKIEIEYREIKEINDNIEKKKTILRLRFPERSFVKKDEKLKAEKSEESSLDVVLEKKVNQLLKLVESQYKSKILPEEAASLKNESGERKPASSEESSSTMPHSAEKGLNTLQDPEDFSQSILLKK